MLFFLSVLYQSFSEFNINIPLILNMKKEGMCLFCFHVLKFGLNASYAVATINRSWGKGSTCH